MQIIGSHRCWKRYFFPAISTVLPRSAPASSRRASYHGWQMAIQKVKPIPRATAQVDLAAMVRAAGCRNAQQAVDVLLARFLSVPVDAGTRARIGKFLESELGTGDLAAAGTFL